MINQNREFPFEVGDRVKVKYQNGVIGTIMEVNEEDRAYSVVSPQFEVNQPVWCDESDLSLVSETDFHLGDWVRVYDAATPGKISGVKYNEDGFKFAVKLCGADHFYSDSEMEHTTEPTPRETGATLLGEILKNQLEEQSNETSVPTEEKEKIDEDDSRYLMGKRDGIELMYSALKMIVADESNGGLSKSDLQSIFDTDSLEVILNSFTLIEILDLLYEYIMRTTYLTVGSECYIISEQGMKCVILKETKSGYYVWKSNGIAKSMEKKDLVPTGRIFPEVERIAGALYS